MYLDVIVNSQIYRTLCEGDIARMESLYGSP